MSARLQPLFALLLAFGVCAVTACDDEEAPAPAAADVGVDAADRPDAEPDVTPDAAAPDVLEDAAVDTGDTLVPGSLLIEPSNPTVELAIGQDDTILFAASRVNDAGVPEPVDATWELSHLRLGSIDPNAGRFGTTGAGGRVRVTASFRGATADTFLTVIIKDTHLDPDVQAGDVGLFDAEDNPEGNRAPELIYPEDGTRFPQNLRGITIQWQTGGNNLFRVHFTSPFVDLVAYTGASVWTPPDALWSTLIRSLAGEPITVSVDGVNGPGEVNRSRNTTAFSFSSDVVTGAIYYWSTADSGIMRLPVGDTAPERFITFGTPPGTPCVGCHTVSRDGKRMAFNTAPLGLPLGPLMAIDVDDPTDRIIDIPQNINGMQPTFSPNGSRIVSGWQGTLTERWTDGTCQGDPTPCVTDADCNGVACVTGQPIQPVPSPNGTKAAFPDWSPDGTFLAAAITRSPIAVALDFEVTQAGLMVVRRDGDGWGIPTVVLEPPTDANTNNTHPATSPDSRWIAFTHKGLGLPDVNGNTVESDLFLISPTSRVPIPLLKAHKGAGYANNWPKWAPTSGEHMWLAFSSSRPYGKVPTSTEGPQIWVTAIDPHKASQGEDPSWPAFWLPYQSPDSGNHIPFWAVYMKEP